MISEFFIWNWRENKDVFVCAHTFVLYSNVQQNHLNCLLYAVPDWAPFLWKTFRIKWHRTTTHPIEMNIFVWSLFRERTWNFDIVSTSARKWTILQNKLTKHTNGENALLAEAVGSDLKGKISLGLYAAAIMLALVEYHISHAIYVIVALIWLVPDRRIERVINK